MSIELSSPELFWVLSHEVNQWNTCCMNEFIKDSFVVDNEINDDEVEVPKTHAYLILVIEQVT